MIKNLLLIIDPQVDFINGSLPVPGAAESMNRLARFIDQNSNSIEDILVTLDSHQPGHVSFRSSWVAKIWEDEQDITGITSEMISQSVKPKYQWLNPEDISDYIKRIPGQRLDLWPDHCVIGTPGHSIWPNLKVALDKWSNQSKRIWEIIMKGNRPDREMYSAILCDGDENIGLLCTPKIDSNLIESYDKIYIAGIAKDFCVASTVKDLLEQFGDEIKDKLVFIDDCMPGIIKGNESCKVYDKAVENYGAGVIKVGDYNSTLLDYLNN